VSPVMSRIVVVLVVVVVGHVFIPMFIFRCRSFISTIFGPGNGSPSATNVAVVLFEVVIRFSM